MFKVVPLLLLILAFQAFSPAKAEGGCPPGQAPQQGQGWSSCVPIPNYNNGTQPDTFVGPSKEARWIAIATDGGKGILGESSESKTQDDATSTAVRDCSKQGGTECKVLASAKNGCISMATSASAYGAGIGKTPADAEVDAMKVCKAGADKNCRQIYSRCVSPVLI